jgi:hypothetical protein
MIAVASLQAVVSPLPATAAFCFGVAILTLTETDVINPENRDMGELPDDDEDLTPTPPEDRIRGIDLTEDLTPDKETETNGTGDTNEVKE